MHRWMKWGMRGVEGWILGASDGECQVRCLYLYICILSYSKSMTGNPHINDHISSLPSPPSWSPMFDMSLNWVTGWVVGFGFHFGCPPLFHSSLRSLLSLSLICIACYFWCNLHYLLFLIHWIGVDSLTLINTKQRPDYVLTLLTSSHHNLFWFSFSFKLDFHPRAFYLSSSTHSILVIYFFFVCGLQGDFIFFYFFHLMHAFERLHWLVYNSPDVNGAHITDY